MAGSNKTDLHPEALVDKHTTCATYAKLITMTGILFLILSGNYWVGPPQLFQV
jgi:hypothetical protein